MPSIGLEPSPSLPMYIPVRRRMCSSASRVWIAFSSYLIAVFAMVFLTGRAGSVEISCISFDSKDNRGGASSLPRSVGLRGKARGTRARGRAASLDAGGTLG